MTIIHPFSLNNFSSERFLVYQGMLHKEGKSSEIVRNLKTVFNNLKEMHMAKSGDYDTLLSEEILKNNGLNLKGNFSKFYII